MPAYIYRVSQWLEKRFNAKGGQVITDLDPSLGVEMSFPVGVEDRYLQGWNRFAVTQGVTGGAAQNAGAELHNPLGSNAVAVIERLGVRVGATTSSLISITYTTGPGAISDLTTTVNAVRLDNRQLTGSTCIFSTSTNATGFATGIINMGVFSGLESQAVTTTNNEILLMPGSAIITIDLTAAELAHFNYQWRERALELSELT